MALVMLPCDMPWWETLQKQIAELAIAQNVEELITGMQSIHTMCNVGLDPDEPDGADPEVMVGLKLFLSQDLSAIEKENFFHKTLPTITTAALNLKKLKPLNGLRFSLQQEIATVEVKREFACSLIAHAFLSSFPKRTHKTHPTLQDFNFSTLFRHLNENFQKSKLRSIFHYFDLLHDNNSNSSEQIKLTRQVMKSKDWLTIEDWLDCEVPLCPLTIKHDNRMENADIPKSIHVCFSSKKLGGRVLSDGISTECVQFITCPELLISLLCVEALEDNEALIVENLYKVGKINSLRMKGENFEPSSQIYMVNVCCMDAENYTRFPLSQYEEDNVLRELNKALLAFKQKRQISLKRFIQATHPVTRRLSPIGESFSTTPTEKFPLSNEQAVEKKETNKAKLLRYGTRNKFIVLGSSGELLPVSRNQRCSEYSSCSSQDSSSGEFYSAHTSFAEYENTSDEEEGVRRYSVHLDTPENRISFAQKLREALCSAQSSSTDSNYAVDISVAGSSLEDPNIRMKRGGSGGFMLEENSFELSLLENNKTGRCTRNDSSNHQFSFNEDKNKGDSSVYSFSTDYNSDFDEVYEQLSRWLDETPGDSDADRQKIRYNKVIQFAGNLLKRTLSESFVGVPLSEGDGDVNNSSNDYTSKTIKTVVRSLSLELAKYKHKLNTHLVAKSDCQDASATIITGNWGCGSRHLGDPQLKLLIQWLAASVADAPQLVYYTYNHRKLLKLDTVSRILIDRRWNVGKLVQALTHISAQFVLSQTINSSNDEYDTLFDLLINSNGKCGEVTKQLS